MYLDKIEFFKSGGKYKVNIVVDDGQVSYPIIMEAGELFEKITSAFYSATAMPIDPEERDDGLKAMK